MNKFLTLTAAAAALMAAAAPALANPAGGTPATGSVNVTGSVAPKCSSSSFSSNIVLNELAKTDGTLDTTLSSAANTSVGFTVQCSSANPTIQLSATRLVNGTTGASTGYTDTIDYTATATASKAGGGMTPVSYTTAVALPAATSTAIGDRIATTGPNLVVGVSNAHLQNITDHLTAGNYAATISVTVSPTS